MISSPWPRRTSTRGDRRAPERHQQLDRSEGQQDRSGRGHGCRPGFASHIDRSTRSAARATSTWSPLILLGVIIVAIGSIALIWLWIRHTRTRNRVGTRLKEIKSQAVEVMDRLDGLKERLKLMPASPDFNHQMSGQTAALYNKVGDKLGKLWDGWLHVMEVLDKAQKLESLRSLLSQKTLADAEELINQQGSFQEIEKQAQTIAADVDHLDQAHQEARLVLEAITATRPKLDRASGSQEKRSAHVPVSGRAGLPRRRKLAGELPVGPDPLGTKTVLDQLQSRLPESALPDRARRVSLSGCAASQDITRDNQGQVTGHRAQGLKLVEDGGNPDRALEQGEAAHAETLITLRAGDPDAGAQKLGEARSMAQEAQATIEKVQKAKTFCEREQPARVREIERLRTALPQAETYHNDLEREFARSSWQAVARNLEQARALLATFDRQAQDAAAAATNTRQEYLRGAVASRRAGAATTDRASPDVRPR